MMELRIYYLNTSMKPPKNMNIDPELLEITKAACLKFLATESRSPKMTDLVTEMLIGGEWPNDVDKRLEGNCLFFSGLIYLLPSAHHNAIDKALKNDWLIKARTKLEEYLHESTHFS